MDRDILRKLASEIAEIAHLPCQEETKRLYRSVNGLRPIRPVVLIDELPWNQLNDDQELTLCCEDEFFRSIEQSMRRTLYRWHHCRGDMLVEPFYRLPKTILISSMGISIDEDLLSSDPGNNIVSHRYHDQLPDMGSVERLRIPELRMDRQDTARRYDVLSACIGDLLPVHLTGLSGAGFYMPWDELAMWRGVEPIFMDLEDDPEKLHAIMRRYLDIRLDLLRREEEMELLDADLPVLHCTCGLTDDLPKEKAEQAVTRANLWGRGTAQVFASVSPAMHDEFEIEYARKFFDGFGLVYYGCCEPLDRKIDIVKKIPHLRKLSVTPWANVRKCAEQMGPDYVMARKPNPASVAVPRLDQDALREDLLETLTVCREYGTPVEFTLKDISSVSYHPDNLTNWERVAMETVKNF